MTREPIYGKDSGWTRSTHARRALRAAEEQVSELARVARLHAGLQADLAQPLRPQRLEVRHAGRLAVPERLERRRILPEADRFERGAHLRRVGRPGRLARSTPPPGSTSFFSSGKSWLPGLSET